MNWTRASTWAPSFVSARARAEPTAEVSAASMWNNELCSSRGQVEWRTNRQRVLSSSRGGARWSWQRNPAGARAQWHRAARCGGPRGLSSRRSHKSACNTEERTFTRLWRRPLRLSAKFREESVGKRCSNRMDLIDLVTFALMNVKHSVVHKPKLKERVLADKERKTLPTCADTGRPPNYGWTGTTRWRDIQRQDQWSAEDDPFVVESGSGVPSTKKWRLCDAHLQRTASRSHGAIWEQKKLWSVCGQRREDTIRPKKITGFLVADIVRINTHRIFSVFSVMKCFWIN